jgi:ABC-type glutathione transport system ATPase component
LCEARVPQAPSQFPRPAPAPAGAGPCRITPPPLSHGERSRIFIARAGPQSPGVLILDKSFAALDPGHFHSSIEYLLERDSAPVLIAYS